MVAVIDSFDDNYNWGKSPWTFQMPREFSTFKEQLQYMLGEESADGSIRPTLSDYNSFISESTPETYLRPNQSSTQVGGNDAINCYPQFCENDDIIHPLTGINGRTDSGLGRVYSEVYDKNQQILHMTFGVPQFGNLADFYSDMIKTDIASLVNQGEESTVKILGRLIGKVAAGAAIATLAFSIPFLPHLYLAKKLADAIDTHRVTKYYDFKAAMPLYYRYVNSIISHLAVNMGLVPDGTGGNTNGEFNEIYKRLYQGDGTGGLESVPEFLREGPNIYRILSKRDRMLRTDGSMDVDSDDYLLGEKQDDDWFSTFTARINSSMHGADKFVGFRVEKSTDSSESLSNQTGESSVQQMLNSKSSSMRDAMFTFANGQIADLPVLNQIAGALTGLVQGVTSTIGLTGSAHGIMTGSGMVDIPEIWQSSSFSKSYNFNMTLRAITGDPVSIFQEIYIPLALLIAGALPRSVGRNGYTAPFLVRAYLKGQFAVPLGIIESINIKRGASEFGWSNNMLPTTVEVSWTIKDLAPCMHMALMDKGSELFQIFGQNSSFQEYLLTLSGLGLNERLIWTRQVMRKLETSLRILRTTYANPLFWATSIGNASIPRLIGAISPWARYGNR